MAKAAEEKNLELSAGQANDAPMAELLLNDLPKGAIVLADRA